MKTLFLFCSLLAGSFVFAQKSQWMIFLVHGDVQVTAKGKQPVAVKQKQMISTEDKIEIRNVQSEVTFVSKNGDYYQVKEKGSFVVGDWVKQHAENAPGITPKFVAYLYEELLHPAKGYKRSRVESVAASWGAGSRGNECMAVKWPASLIVTSKDTVIFKWGHNSKQVNYNFVMYDKDGDEFFNCMVRDTQLVVNTATLRQVDIKKCSWSVNSVGNPCKMLEKNLMELVSPEDEEKKANKVIRDVPKMENGILYNLAIADALGLAGFYDKAFDYYYRVVDNTRK